MQNAFISKLYFMIGKNSSLIHCSQLCPDVLTGCVVAFALGLIRSSRQGSETGQLCCSMSCEQGLLQLDVVGPFSSSAMPVLSRGEYSLDTIGLNSVLQGKVICKTN